MKIRYQAQGIRKEELTEFGDFAPKFEQSMFDGALWTFEVPNRGELFRTGRKAEAEELRLRLKRLDELFMGLQVV